MEKKSDKVADLKNTNQVDFLIFNALTRGQLFSKRFLSKCYKPVFFMG